jgi:hypothetical protein
MCESAKTLREERNRPEVKPTLHDFFTNDWETRFDLLPFAPAGSGRVLHPMNLQRRA